VTVEVPRIVSRKEVIVDRRRIGASRSVAALFILFVAVVAAACSSSSPTAAPSPAATVAPPTAATTPNTPDDVSYHSAPELEKLLPDSLGGFRLEKGSQVGSDLRDPGRPFTDMLANLGRTISDFSVASAYARDLKAEVGMWQINGANEKDLVPEFIKAVQGSSTTPLVVGEMTVGGRPVTRIGEAGQLTKGPIYVYVKDGLLIFVETPDSTLAEEALSKLP
jgi:hypothetical protein